MEVATTKKLMVFSGSAHEALAKEVCDLLQVPLGHRKLSRFANGEIYVRFDDSVRGADVFVIQSHSAPINEHIMEQLVMIDALKRASAKRITAVVPFFPYSRQDKKALSREPISARLIGDLFTAAGTDRIVSIDLHSAQIQGFVDMPFDHLLAVPLIVDYLKDRLVGEPITMVSPDAGRVKMLERYGRHMDAPIAIVHKRRSATEHNTAHALDVVGEVEGRTCVIMDDIVDTAGTLCAAADLLADRGARHVFAAATHGVLSPASHARLASSAFEEVIITNSLPVPDGLVLDKLKVLSIAPLLAGALDAIFMDRSVSGLFHGEHF